MNIYYKAEMKFCVSIRVHAHAYTKRPTTSKCGIAILENFFKKSRSDFFKNRSKFS